VIKELITEYEKLSGNVIQTPGLSLVAGYSRASQVKAINTRLFWVEVDR